MRELLSKMGRSFLRAFAASVLVYSTGVLAAPNLNQAYALGVAAIVAALAAGLGAVNALVPQLTFGGVYGAVAGSAVRAFIAAFLTGWIGILNAPDLSVTIAAVTAVVIPAATAALRVLQ